MPGAKGHFFKVLILLCLLFLLPYLSAGQGKELETLKTELSVAKDSLSAMRIINKLGFLISMKSADSCFYYGQRANSIAEKLNDTRGKADALANMGIGLALKGLYSQSLKYYSKSYSAYANLPDTLEMAQMLMNSAITYSFTSDSMLTAEFAQRAVSIAKNFKTDSLASMLYANYAELGNLKADSSIFYLDKANKISEKFKDDRTLLFIMQQKAELLIDSKKYSEALNFIKRSILLARRHKWDYHEMEGLNVYGTYFLAINKPDSALKCYKQIAAMAATNDYVFWKVDVLKAILNVYKVKHDLAAQVNTSALLAEALEQRNQNNNSFLGDYIRFNENQEKLEKLNQVNARDHNKELGFIAISIIGALLTLTTLLAYRNSRKQKKELQELNRKISAQNEVLQNNEEFNALLLSMLAHDFRAPLGQTMAMISLLKDNEEPDLRTRLNFYDEVENSIRNILNTFDSILEWIKKQLSGYKPVINKLNLFELIEESIEFFKHPIAKKSLIFNNLLSPGLTAGGDIELMRFINRNLVHNAVKHSPHNSIITASVKYNPNEIIIAIKNEGKGMSEKQLNELFKFKEQHSGEKGAGMALALSSEFIALLHGRIWAESVPGESTTFFYSLPI